MYYINKESMATAFGVTVKEIDNTVNQLAAFYTDSGSFDEPDVASKKTVQSGTRESWSVLANGGRIVATDLEVKYLPGMCFNDTTPPQPLAPGWEKVAASLITGDPDTLMEEGF